MARQRTVEKSAAPTTNFNIPKNPKYGETINLDGQGYKLVQIPELEGKILEIPIEIIHPNPTQPRQDFQEGITELADSLEDHQEDALKLIPLESPSGEVHFIILDGERRFRAAQKRKMPVVKAVISWESNIYDISVRAYIANEEREDLNPIEEAEFFQRSLLALQTEYEYTEEQALKIFSNRIGKKGTYIQERLKLLTLIPSIQGLVRKKTLKVTAAKIISQAGLNEEKQNILAEILRRTVEITVQKVRQEVKRVENMGGGKAIKGSALEKKEKTILQLSRHVGRTADRLEDVSPRAINGGSKRAKQALNEELDRLIAAAQHLRSHINRD